MNKLKRSLQLTYIIRNWLLIFLLFGISVTLKGQDPIKVDSLKAGLKFAEDNGEKISYLWELSALYSNVDFDIALSYSTQALELSEEIDDKNGIAKSTLQIGTIYANSGDYDEAMKNIMISLDLLKDQETGSQHFKAYLMLGVLHDRIYNYDQALEYYFQCMNISNELKTRGDTSDIDLREQTLYNNIGNIYETRNENETAIEYYERGLALALKRKDLFNQGIIYNNLGKINDKLLNYDTAYYFLMKSLDVRKSSGDQAGVAKSYYFLSGHFMDVNDLPTARDYAQQSYELGKEVGSLQTQFTALWFLYRTSYELGNFKEALNFHENYKEISDSLYNNNTLKEITRLRMQHDFDVQETRRQLENQKTRLKFVIIVSALIFGMLLLGFIIVLSRLKSRRIRLEKDNLEKDVELKNKELATNVMYMVRKNEMINNVAKKLLDLKEVAVEKNKKPIQDIVLELQSEADQGVWREFEMRFQQVHKEFYDNLLAKHPDLTPSESRLVALLRLNMTTKEIAAITHQNLKSVDVARARLRKKLNLTGTDTNLVGYLNSL